MMIRLRGGGRGAVASKTSRVEICNAVVDRARVRTASIRSAPAKPVRPARPAAGAGTAGAPPRRPTPYRSPHLIRRTCPGAAAWE